MDGKHSSPTLVLFHFRAITSGTHSPVKLQSIKSRNISILQKCGVKHMQRPYLPVQRGEKTYTEAEKLSLETTQQITADKAGEKRGCFHSGTLLMPGCHRPFNEYYKSPKNIYSRALN